MKLRSIMAALALALIALPAAQAQERGAGPGERRIQMMFKDITLTSVQRTKIDSIMAHYRTRMVPMTPGSPPDSAAMASRRVRMQTQSADLRAVLTQEQQPVFDRNLREMRAAMQRRQSGS